MQMAVWGLRLFVFSALSSLSLSLSFSYHPLSLSLSLWLSCRVEEATHVPIDQRNDPEPAGPATLRPADRIAGAATPQRFYWLFWVLHSSFWDFFMCFLFCFAGFYLVLLGFTGILIGLLGFLGST